MPKNQTVGMTQTGRRYREMIDFPELCLVVASYIVVAGVSAWIGLKAGAELMRRYWEGRQ